MQSSFYVCMKGNSICNLGLIYTAIFFQKGSAYYQQSLLLYSIAPLMVYNQEFQSQPVFHLYFQKPSFTSSPWLPQIFFPFC